jgi:hypothetical protein
VVVLGSEVVTRAGNVGGKAIKKQKPPFRGDFLVVANV